jgi:hypothetical protein
MKMKISHILAIIIFFFIKVNANEINLDNKFLPLKDFLILKFDLFFKENVSRVFAGGGLTNVSYQKIDYNIKIDENNKIDIVLDAVMDKERYKSKKYYPKIKDCNQIRNMILVNKKGYSFFKQEFNNLVNTENLSKSINESVLNISSLDDNLKGQILEKTLIKINIIHPKLNKNKSCGGKLIDSILE